MLEENDIKITDNINRLCFSIASGSIVGCDHISVGKNNQDGYHVLSDDDLIIGIVCDGCGSDSSPHSEVGAKIGSRIVANELYQLINDVDDAQNIIESLRHRVIHKLEIICRYMGDTKVASGRFSRSETIKNYFLFTVLGFAITPKRTIVFGIGDGYNALNGVTKYIEPNEGNQPTYLSYGLVNTDHDNVKFNIYYDGETDNVETILIGSDGLSDVVKNQNSNMPGKKETIGDLSQFWTNDFFFKNPDGIRRRLYLMNKTCHSKQQDGSQKTEYGILKDDTTLIVVRRNNNG